MVLFWRYRWLVSGLRRPQCRVLDVKRTLPRAASRAAARRRRAWWRWQRSPTAHVCDARFVPGTPVRGGNDTDWHTCSNTCSNTCSSSSISWSSIQQPESEIMKIKSNEIDLIDWHVYSEGKRRIKVHK